VKRNGKYRVNNANICIRCENVEVLERGGYQGCICAKCHKELQELYEHYKKHGLYLTAKPMTGGSD